MPRNTRRNLMASFNEVTNFEANEEIREEVMDDSTNDRVTNLIAYLVDSGARLGRYTAPSEDAEDSYEDWNTYSVMVI